MFYTWLYFDNRFKDVYLPDQQNWLGKISLLQSETGWQGDIYIPVRCLDGVWYLNLADGFSWKVSDDPKNTYQQRQTTSDETPWEPAQEAKNHEVVIRHHTKVTMSNGSHSIGLLFTECEKKNTQFEKYRAGHSRIVIGRSSSCEIYDSSLLIAREHGQLSQTDGGWNYMDRSQNGTYLNGVRLSNANTRLRFGDVLTFPSGLKIVFLNEILAINYANVLTHVHLALLPDPIPPVADDRVPQNTLITEHHRSPRILIKSDETPINIEPPLAKVMQNEQPLWMTIGPSATMVIPMFLGLLATRAAGSGTMMLSGLVMIGGSSALAVMWGLAGSKHRKKEAAATEKTRLSLYRSYIGEIEAQMREYNSQELNRLLATCPDITACSEFPVSGNTRLWERMPSHRDFMAVRLGRGDVPLPNPIQTQEQKLNLIDDPLRKEPERLRKGYGTIHNAPFTLDLRNETVVGILGNQEATAHAQGILLQLASLHSYHDVRIAVLTDEGTQSRWGWARWLPHVYANEDRQLRMVVSSPSAIQEVMSHLNEVLLMRKEAVQNRETNDDENAPEIPVPHYVVFCTNPKLLENKPLLRNMLTNRWGMTLIIITKTSEMLPKECHIMINPSQRPGLLITSEGNSFPVEYEYPNQTMLERFAKKIAPLRVNDSEQSAAIPTKVPFLDIYNVRDVKDLDIWRFWNENQSYDGLRSTIGMGAGSQPFILDISDNSHGPHGLIAGTTGSGKSVMLETYILSLAVNFHPDQVRFIIIDYKGGGMANTFRKLPHVTGIVDNLQGERIISRALASLQGEIHRRELIFKRVGVNNIHDYVRLYGNTDTNERIPHLIIIVDEFAELISEQREFMQDLVSAARVGRSLGLHLILATQKPSNSVSDEIWSNTNFRICLRVQTRSDSNEMLHRPDAAYIKQRGRCFVQIGNDEIFEQVQTSFSGVEYSPHERLDSDIPHILSDAGQPITIKTKVYAPNEKKYTQMDAVLHRIDEVIEEHSMTKTPRMWREELNSVITLDSIAEFAMDRFRDGKWPVQSDSLNPIYALADDVAGQRYITMSVDIAALRNMMIVGQASTGKTTLLQTLAVSLTCKYDPAHVQIYAFSLSSTILNSLRAFPHVGDVVLEGEVYETLRLIDLLSRENRRRGKLFATASTNNFQEYNRGQAYRNKPTIPSIVVLIDRIQQLRDIIDNDDAYSNRFLTLISEASARGIYFIATAMKVNEFQYKIRDSFKGVALQLNDRSDSLEILGVRVPREIPDVKSTYGRGFAVEDGIPHEIQVALYDSSVDIERNEAILSLGKEMDDAWTGMRPMPIPRIPEKANIADFDRTVESLELPEDPYALPLAYNIITGLPEVISLKDSFAYLLIGPNKSGKTNAMQFLANHFRKIGSELILFGKDEWMPFATRLGVPLYTDAASEELSSAFSELKEKVTERALQLKAAGAISLEEKAAVSRTLKPIVLLLDNIDVFCDRATQDKITLLNDISSRGAGFAIYLFVAVSQQGYIKVSGTSFINTLVSQQRGIALGGKLNNCDPWNIAMPYQVKNISLPVGRGYFMREDTPQQILFPLVTAN